MDSNGNLRDDMRLPDDNEDDKVISKRITEGVDNMKDIFATVLQSMGIEKVIDAAEKTN